LTGPQKDLWLIFSWQWWWW